MNQRRGRPWSQSPAIAIAAVILVGLAMVLGRDLSGGGQPPSTARVNPTATIEGSPAGASPAPTDVTPAPSPAGSTPIPLSEADVPATANPLPTPPREWHLDIPILTYHVIAPWSVASTYSERRLDVDPALFDAQLALLHAKGWHTITASRLWRYIAARQRPPAKTFVITIDDGHADGYTYALPILERYGFVATFYVVVGRVGHPDNLTWNEIATLKAAGMEIGNHTMDHVDLANSSLAQVLYEVESAQLILAAHLGAAPTTLAYPFWAFDNEVIRIVRAAGLRMALTRGPRPYESASWRFMIPRFEVGSGMSAVALLTELAPYS